MSIYNQSLENIDEERIGPGILLDALIDEITLKGKSTVTNEKQEIDKQNYLTKISQILQKEISNELFFVIFFNINFFLFIS